ncbi:MAG: cytochrome-c peroxidase, partial [Bacteroidota bacterium]
MTNRNSSFMTQLWLWVFAFLLIFWLLACQEEALTITEQNEFISALPEQVLYPVDNPYTQEKEELGRLLYWDPILSGTKEVACVTCHHPNLGYADGLDFSQGVGGIGLGQHRSGGVKTRRNAPTVINTAFNGIDNDGVYNPAVAPMFWDNRAESLEGQALLPMLS